jgi:hypothetical protein
MASTENQVETICAKQVLKLSSIPVFVYFVIEGQNLEVSIGLGVFIFVDERSNKIGARRKGMVKSQPYDLRFFVLTLVQKISEKILGQIAVIEIVVTEFRLDAGLWRNCELGENIAHGPLLIVVFSKSIRLIMEKACAI